MPGSGSVQLTGKLGDVLKESVEVALSWVKAHAYELALTNDPTENIMRNRSIHVHCPGGAIPKDGPSAGMAHAVALISLFSGRGVRGDLALTVCSEDCCLSRCCQRRERERKKKANVVLAHRVKSPCAVVSLPWVVSRRN